MSAPLLVLEDVHASYVKKEILRGVTLTVEPSEIVALLGGNGSGKSTTLKVIAGLLVPTRGRIWFDGKDITRATPHERQGMGIGYLLQGGRVFPNLTVEDNLQVALSHARSRDIGQHAAAPSLGRYFPELSERGAMRAGLLSGGQRQMLAIEMVLAQKPRLALLDEPSAALAEQRARTFFGRFANQAAQDGQTVLVVEQNVAAMDEVKSRTLRLHNGILSLNRSN